MPWAWKDVKSGEISKTAKTVTREGLFVQANLKRVDMDAVHNGFRAVEVDKDFNEIKRDPAAQLDEPEA